MLITRAIYYCCFSYYFLFLLVPHCDARKSSALIFRALPARSKISSNVVKHLDILGIVGSHVLLDSTNSQPYYGSYGSLSSPFTLPPFESLPPMPLPQTNPPVCLYPPSTTLPPSSPGTTAPGGGGSSGGGGGGGGFPYQSPPPPPSSSSNIPPTLPTENPPPSPVGTSPIGTTPSPNPPTGGYVPSPTEPILSPPFSSAPSPPFSYEPSPPSGIVPSPPSGTVPSPPFSFTTPTTPIGGFVPSPPVFQPPVVYPPPRGPPSPPKGAKQAMWCVVKPGVPDPIVQEAVNYACGSGADCDSLQPNGSCFEPNTLFAHASYAFNSYWQRTKVAGGTCDFGGSAIIVTVDPSYDGCHFMYN